MLPSRSARTSGKFDEDNAKRTSEETCPPPPPPAAKEIRLPSVVALFRRSRESRWPPLELPFAVVIVTPAILFAEQDAVEETEPSNELYENN